MLRPFGKQLARTARRRARDHERRCSARAPALQAVTPKLGIQARVPEATLDISVEGAGWSTALAVARRRAVAHGEACLSPVAHALGTPTMAHHCSRCAPASTSIADIEGRTRVAPLNTELQRDRLQSRRARRAAPFMVTRVGRRAGAAPQICDRVLEVLATRFPLEFVTGPLEMVLLRRRLAKCMCHDQRLSIFYMVFTGPLENQCTRSFFWSCFAAEQVEFQKLNHFRSFLEQSNLLFALDRSKLDMPNVALERVLAC